MHASDLPIALQPIAVCFAALAKLGTKPDAQALLGQYLPGGTQGGGGGSAYLPVAGSTHSSLQVFDGSLHRVVVIGLPFPSNPPVGTRVYQGPAFGLGEFPDV